jgi:hypothetical protein
MIKAGPNPSLNADVPRAGAAPAAAGRRLAPIRWASNSRSRAVPTP